MRDSIIRISAAFAGLSLLGIAAHVNIQDGAGYGSTQSFVLIGAAIALGIGAIVIDEAWQRQKWFLAIAMTLALLCGEAFALLSTAERVIGARDQQQQPLRVAAETRAKAAQRLEFAERALAGVGSTPRLERALAAQSEVATTVAEKAAQRDCATNCRKLLEQQTAAASDEVSAARAEIERQRSAAEHELAQARFALGGQPVPRSPDRLAAILHWPSWGVDLTAAALASISINFLGALFLAFAAHRPAASKEIEKVVYVERQLSEDEHAAHFMADRLRWSREALTPTSVIGETYEKWCDDKGIKPLPIRQIAPQLSAAFENAGIAVRDVSGRRVAIGIALQATPQRALIANAA